MITLDKIQELDKKIQEAVTLITTLRQEKRELQDELELANEQIKELEGQLNTAQVDQDQIEEGILGALSKIDGIGEETETVPQPEESEVQETTPEAEETTDTEKSVEAEEVAIEEPASEETEVMEETVVAEPPSDAGIVEREESVIDEEEEEKPQSLDFSFSGGTMAASTSNDQVNHSEPQPIQEEQEPETEETVSEEASEERELEESRSEQDLDIF